MKTGAPWTRTIIWSALYRGRRMVIHLNGEPMVFSYLLPLLNRHASYLPSQCHPLAPRFTCCKLISRSQKKKEEESYSWHMTHGSIKVGGNTIPYVIRNGGPTLHWLPSNLSEAFQTTYIRRHLYLKLQVLPILLFGHHFPTSWLGPP